MKLTAERKEITECTEGSSEHGNSTMYVTCPFCGEENEVYIWSFAACGKKCGGNGCKVHLTSKSGAFLEVEVNKAQLQIMEDLKQFIISERDSAWWPSKHSLNALVKKGLIIRGRKNAEFGYMLTDMGAKCLSQDEQ